MSTISHLYYAPNIQSVKNLILLLADEFEIRISWDKETAIITGIGALLGGLIGGYTGGKISSIVGAGVGGLAAYSTAKSLRELWDRIEPKLVELVYITINFLRTLHPSDYSKAFVILMMSANNKRLLVLTIVEFLANKFERQVFSTIKAA
ncbi:uncharacterized protein [Battus philenor]|uniref:uncharacterized protein n=1 Tax=Battus philenor TaxID=42288 RepID=UPI0035CF60CA